MKKLLWLFIILLPLGAKAGTVTGQITTATNGSIVNGTLTLTLNQYAVVSGTAAIAPSAVNCFTDAVGNVVGLPNPLVAPVLSVNLAAGTLPGGTYFVVYAWSNSTGTTFYSPESSILLTGAGTLVVTVPASPPAGATNWKIFIGTSSLGETQQISQGTPFSNYSQATALSAGAALPASNTSTCSLRFNDELVPSFTKYNVSLKTSSGATVSGFPMFWQLFGGNAGTINVSNGYPLASNAVVYPFPIVSNPNAQSQQSINGSLTLGAFTLTAGGATFTGNVSLGTNSLTAGAINIGSSPLVYDVTTYGAKCDGSTDDSSAILAAIDAAKVNGGAVTLPVGKTCVAASQLLRDNLNTVILTTYGEPNAWNAGTSRATLALTGSTSPALSMRNCIGCAIIGIQVQCRNAAMTGTCISFGTVSGGQSSFVTIADSAIQGDTSSGPHTGILMAFDNAINVTLKKVRLLNAQVAIQGAASGGSQTDNFHLEQVAINVAGQCSVPTAFIQNPGQNWQIYDPDFEIGNCTSTPAMFNFANGYAPAYGIEIVGGFIGDQTGIGSGTLFALNNGGGGTLTIIGTEIDTVTANTNWFSLPTNAIFALESFASRGSTAGTILTVGSNNDITLLPGNWAATTITTFMSGTPASGIVWDNGSPQVATFYQNGAAVANNSGGKWTATHLVASTDLQVGGGTTFTGSIGTGTQIASSSGIAELWAGCNGTASASSTLFLFTPGNGATTCTDTTGISDVPMTRAATIAIMQCVSFSAGVNASSGVMTVQKNGVSQSVTCTFGTGTSCSDSTHSFSVAAGDKIRFQMTTQAAETLGSVRCAVEKQ